MLFLVVQRKHFATSTPVQITECLLKSTQEASLFTFRALTSVYTILLFFLAREHTLDLSMLVCGLILILVTDAQYHAGTFMLFVFVLSTLHK